MMRYIVLTVAALAALANALPIAEPNAQLVDTQPDATIGLGKPSTVITWGKRDLVDGKPGSTIELGTPTTVVTWGKRDLIFEPTKPEDTIGLGKPTTVITWGKE